MSEPLVFYDLKRNVPDKANWAWSPHAWRTRLALNIKEIPYRTEWLDFTEIALKMKELGVPPDPNSPIKYTVPTIYDPNTKRVITDSQVIARYLDDQYPDTVNLLPLGTRALQAAFISTNARMIIVMFPVLVAHVLKTVAKHDEEYFRRSRMPFLGGKTIEEAYPQGDALVETVRGFEKILDEIAGWIDANGPNAVFIGGELPVNADVHVTAALMWIVKVLPQEHLMRQAVKDANGGRWTAYLEAFSKWTSRVD